jgi:hypothetical protein
VLRAVADDNFASLWSGSTESASDLAFQAATKLATIFFEASSDSGELSIGRSCTFFTWVFFTFSACCSDQVASSNSIKKLDSYQGWSDTHPLRKDR